MSARLRLFVLSAPVALVCLVLTLLTLPGVPASVAGWGAVFEFVADAPYRWVLPAAGWTGFAVLAVYLWRRPHPGDTQTDAPGSPDPQPDDGLRITITQPNRSSAPSPRPAPAPDGLRPVSQALREALARELDEGRRLARATEWFLPTAANWGRRQTTAGDVSEWEKRVVHLLNRAERWESAEYFLADVPQPRPEPLAGAWRSIATSPAMRGRNPALERRLDFRIVQLNTIIKRKL
jgi:hypothetical protein